MGGERIGGLLNILMSIVEKHLINARLLMDCVGVGRSEMRRPDAVRR